MNKKYEVAVNLQQDFNATEQTQGRNNIGAASASDMTALQSQVSSLSDVSAYTVKGEATVAQLNAGPSGIQAGWAYQLTDSGTLTDGSLAVVAGDTVAWDGTKWFPLVKSDYYATKQEQAALTTYVQNEIAKLLSLIPSGTISSNKLVNRSELEAYVKEFFGPYYVIGGRLYRCVKIYDKVWMAENLDFKFPGLAIGSWSSAPSAGYYNNDEAQYGIDGNKKCGLLYNWYAAKYLEDNKATLIPGWHVPTADEISELISNVGANAGTKLKALDNSVDSGTWPTAWAGSDNFGFAVLPSGNYSSGFSNIGVYANIWSSSSNDESSAWRRNFSIAGTTSATSSPKTFGFSIRLVKD